MRFYLSLIALLYGLSLSTVAAQSTGATITGTIRDPVGQVIVDAEVQMLNIGSGTVFKTMSNSEGKYEMSLLSLGSYMLSIKSPGFAVATRSLTLRRNEPYIEDFSLVPGIIESSITVTAGKGNARVVAHAPQMVTVTEQSDVERRRPVSTTRALELTPNLITINANPALERPRLRGLASNRLLILLDGERLNNVRSDPTSGVSPSIVDVVQLEACEVLSGAGSSLYGSDAMAGVINLITPDEEPRDNVVGLRFSGDLRTNGGFRRGAATINWNTSRFAARLSGSLFRENAYHIGNEEIPLTEVVRLGNLATAMGNEAGNNVARTYAVWSLPAGGEVANSQGHGFNDQADVRFFPNVNHSIRYRQLNSQHKDLGFAFIAPPFDPRRQFNSFRRLDKYGLRYEGRQLRSWLPRVAASFYRQKYSFPDDTLTSQILFDSSWNFFFDPNSPLGFFSTRLTGNPSSFDEVNFSENKNSITTHGLDLQATFAPFVGALLTTGVGYLRDSSVDEFSRTDLVAPFTMISGRASTPDTDYTNWSWFNLFEHEPFRWLRLNGGLRVDNWSTQAKVTRGFPLGIESTLLDRSFAFLLAVPGQIDTTGAAGLIDLVKGVNGISTSRTVVTGTASAVVRLPQGINPYFRWGTSYREPGITERYLLRNFGDPSFSVLVIPNTTLRPERGREFDFGVKVKRAKWNVSASYFRNDLKDFIGNTSAGPYIIPIDPAIGLSPISLEFPFHGVLYVQRVNTERARIQGLETQYEVNLPMEQGVISAFGSTGWLKGTNLTPDEITLRLLSRFYNRPDTPVELRGSADDAPLSNITPLRTINGIRFDSLDRRWFAEYELRYQAQVKRADPLDLSAAISTEYGTFRSLSSFAVQSLRAGYTVRGEKHRILFTVGLENLTNRLYFEHFQTAPAPGRGLVFGTTVELMNLLN